MSNDFPNCGVVDQFHNDLLVEGLTDSDNIPTLPGTWPPIEVEAKLPLPATWTRGEVNFSCSCRNIDAFRHIDTRSSSCGRAQKKFCRF
jgi:hypothetical protein